ncbi:MAG: hypothetical protein IPK52_26100 [Chloroflexi bacterium]|nr:hypothetical protein [Chloroflexota bacterium]
MSMTENGITDKTSERRTFLQALFGSAPDDLYFELRCIHPGDLPPRTFWSRIGDKRTLASAFKRAEASNGEGYGVYFAPCLRNTRSGKAEAAALLPAFWLDIDCDGDASRRETASNRLRAFQLPPSAILDSGGGLHAYWLLTESLPLADSATREKAASILRGLSEALDGDPQYVKSAASVMRLPGSINTKPERGGATVTVLELDTELRYALEQFAWLEAKPQPVERIGGLNVVTLNQVRLPERTETYLASGASEGSRNHELFAAACQMRDAGSSQSEAERELVPRHVASGGSEREALTTIRSAYSRPPREADRFTA